MNTSTIEMDDIDFIHLWANSMNWRENDWTSQDGRFHPMPSYVKFDRIYWFENMAELILARSYLKTLGIEYSQHFDDADDQPSFVLLTDFGGKI